MKTRLLLALAAMCCIAGVLSLGAAPRRPQSTYKNLQVLKGMSDADVDKTMQTWATQLGAQCIFCHLPDDRSADDKRAKATARVMATMVQAMNETQPFFKDGRRKADCWLCHRGNTAIARTPAPPGLN